MGITLNSSGGGGAWNNLCGPRIRFRVIRGRERERERVSAEIFNYHSTNTQGEFASGLQPRATDAFVVACTRRAMFIGLSTRNRSLDGEEGRETSRHELLSAN